MIVDSSVFIASVIEHDANNRRAKELLAKASEERAFTTDHVLDEVITYLNRKAGSGIAFKAGIGILDSFELIFFSDVEIREALELIRKYQRLSLCDALSVVAAKGARDRAICSFDTDFDFVKDISRIC